MQIHIQVKLFATFLDRLPENADKFPVQKGADVVDLLNMLNIDPREAKLVFINGRKGSHADVLAEGDRVGLFPPVGGG